MKLRKKMNKGKAETSIHFYLENRAGVATYKSIIDTVKMFVSFEHVLKCKEHIVHKTNLFPSHHCGSCCGMHQTSPFSGSAVVRVCCLPMRGDAETWVRPLGWEDTLE